MATAMDFSTDPEWQPIPGAPPADFAPAGSSPSPYAPPGSFPNAYAPPIGAPQPSGLPKKVYPPGLAGIRARAAAGENISIQDMIGAMPDYQKLGGDSYDRFKKLAMGVGPSDIYKAQNQQIGLNTGNQLNSLARDQSSAYQTGVSNLASSGGVDAGSMERLNRNANQNRINASSNIYAGQGAAQAGALTQDAQMRQDMLTRLTGLDANDLNNQNVYNLNQYNDVGDIIGNIAKSKAIAEGGGGGAKNGDNSNFMPGGIGGHGSLGSWDVVGNYIDAKGTKGLHSPYNVTKQFTQQPSSPQFYSQLGNRPYPGNRPVFY